MAETCAIDFLYPTSYSTSIPIGGLSALLLPFLMCSGPDLENFALKRQRLCPYLAIHYTKSKKPTEMVFARLIARWELYWYSL